MNFSLNVGERNSVKDGRSPGTTPVAIITRRTFHNRPKHPALRQAGSYLKASRQFPLQDLSATTKTFKGHSPSDASTVQLKRQSTSLGEDLRQNKTPSRPSLLKLLQGLIEYVTMRSQLRTMDSDWIIVSRFVGKSPHVPIVVTHTPHEATIRENWRSLFW